MGSSRDRKPDRSANGLSLFSHLVSTKAVIIMVLIFVSGMVLNKVFFEPYFTMQANGNPYIETMLFYTPQTLYTLVDDYGAHGREMYTKWSIGLDFILPLQYSVCFASCAAWISRKLSLSERLGRVALVSGTVLCLSDWLENVFLLIVVNRFPQMLIAVSVAANVMTLLKSALTIAFLAAIGIGFLIYLVHRITEK